jgi:hypothetical protein
MRTLSVWALKMMRIIPAMKNGRETMWYSRGLNEYAPYHLRRYANTKNRIPIRVSNRIVFSIRGYLEGCSAVLKNTYLNLYSK